MKMTARQSLRVATVSYICDLADVRCQGSIPLGVMVELRVGDIYGVGLQARPEISSDEAKRVGTPMRNAVRDPAKILKPILNGLMKTHNGTGLEKLQEKYRGSLQIAVISVSEKRVPTGVVIGGSDSRAKWAAEKIGKKLQAEFRKHCGGEPKLEPRISRSKPFRELQRVVAAIPFKGLRLPRPGGRAPSAYGKQEGYDFKLKQFSGRQGQEIDVLSCPQTVATERNRART